MDLMTYARLMLDRVREYANGRGVRNGEVRIEPRYAEGHRTLGLAYVCSGRFCDRMADGHEHGALFGPDNYGNGAPSLWAD